MKLNVRLPETISLPLPTFDNNSSFATHVGAYVPIENVIDPQSEND